MSETDPYLAEYQDRLFDHIVSQGSGLLSGLFATLPETSAGFSQDQRNHWFRMADEIFKAIYDREVDQEKPRLLQEQIDALGEANRGLHAAEQDALETAGGLLEEKEEWEGTLKGVQARLAKSLEAAKATASLIRELTEKLDELECADLLWGEVWGDPRSCEGCGEEITLGLQDVVAKAWHTNHVPEDGAEDEDEPTQPDVTTPVPGVPPSPPISEPESVPEGGPAPERKRQTCPECGEHPRSFKHRSTCVLNRYADDYEFTEKERLQAAALFKVDNKVGVISIIEYVVGERLNKAEVTQEDGHRHQWKIEFVDGSEQGKCSCGAKREFTNEPAGAAGTLKGEEK